MEVKKDGQKVTIAVELEKQGYPSCTGKTTVLFTSGGFCWVQGMGFRKKG